METQNELFGKCPYATMQKVLSGKWTLIILYHLSSGTLRFNELNKLVPDLTQTTLTKQLRQLELYGLVMRKVYPQIPPKVEYSLNAIGEDFKIVLDSLHRWGDKYIEYLREVNELKNASI